MIGDRLFRVTPRDAQITPLDLIVQRSNRSAASTGMFSAMQVPFSSVLVLKSASLEATGGGAQIAQLAFISIATENNALTHILNIDRSTTLQRLYLRNDYAELYIPPGWFIRADAVFSAAVSNNAVDFSVVGHLVPRGNVSFGSCPITVG